ncbi:hypothetical protein Aple_026610 [Acrocarpospora pleiomorpha]|uniref:N-acetyltransferase domain-containing protein n=1 Tax=Acrocarpospora pleiomorpha TaxID=90975 RepID=A0A5M3XDT8_9ACTN|nr:hypothetical protein Aple_026610 [Acrocarpospora pleiomorpha]
MRKTATDPQGVPVITYRKGVRDGLPWADNVEVVGPEPAKLIMSDFVGWAVSVQVDLGTELIESGARLSRHAHTMYCDLTGTLPPADSAAPPGFGFAPAHEHEGREMVAAMVAAYPPGHPDHSGREPEDAYEQELAPLISGQLIGELLPCSSVAVDGGGAVVGGVLVNQWRDVAWISEVFRHPDKSPPGLGARLIRHVQLRGAADGLPTIGLAVSYANPAKHVYARLGFAIADTMMTVIIDP